MTEYDLSGAMLVKIEYGLVSNLVVQQRYTTPYYLKLYLVKGNNQHQQIFPSWTEQYIHRSFLGKIVKDFIEKEGNIYKLVFIDNSEITFA